MTKRYQGKRLWMLAGGVLLLAALGCDVLGGGTPTVAPEEVGGPSPTPSGPPPPTDTPVPDVVGPGECTLNASFVTDVTVPDDTQFPPGASFTKTWRLRNSGTCPWEPGTLLVFISGDPLGGPGSVPAGSADPDSTADVSVNLVAPTSPGTYTGNWQLQAPDGTRFGSAIRVRIVVPASATETPTSPSPVCTPPACAPGEVLHCPGSCPGGCGVQCVTPTGGCVAADPALEPIHIQAWPVGVNVGCPTGGAISVQGALQEFWTNVDNPNPHTHSHDYMIWRADTRKIYALALYSEVSLNGTLYVFDDQWVDGMPHVHPDCAGMTPPVSGYELPVRGFGKVWCEHGLWNTVGWPNFREWTVELLIQPAERGLLIRASGHVSGYTYLYALDFPGGKWTTIALGP